MELSILNDGSLKFWLNLIPPLIEQSDYNIMVRNRIENEYRDLIKRYKIWITICSVLANGILTGKYIIIEY